MNNIFKAFNVSSQMEFDRLVESLKLNDTDTISLFTLLDESKDIETLRNEILETSATFGNGSYETLKEQMDKPTFVRTLKVKPQVTNEGITDKIWVKKEPEHSFALCDTDGMIQWCYIVEVSRDGNLSVEPIMSDYGPKPPTFSVKPKDIVRYATPEEEKLLNDEELDPYVSFGKSREKEPGIGYKDEPKKLVKEGVNNNYVSPKFKIMVDAWMTGDEVTKSYVSVLDDLVYLFSKLNNYNEVKRWIEYFYQMPIDDDVMRAGETILRYFQQDPTNMITKDDHYLYNYLDDNGVREIERIKQKNNINEKRKNFEQELKYYINESINTEIDLNQILGTMKKALPTILNKGLLKQLFNTLKEKLAIAKSQEDIEKINVAKKAIQDRAKEIDNIGKEETTEDGQVNECFTYDTSFIPSFNDVEVNTTLDDMFNSIKPKNVEINITYEDKPEEEDLVSREQAIDDLFSLSSHIDNNVVLSQNDVSGAREEEMEVVKNLLADLEKYFQQVLGE